MCSFGFVDVMGNPQETWRMEFTVVDRAGHRSTVSSTPFTLQEITQ
jgi:hypothetical protein